MGAFTFVVDRRYRATRGLSLSPSWDLTGDPIAVPPGSEVVYRGLIELAGAPRHVFKVRDRHAYTADRAQLEDGLTEELDQAADFSYPVGGKA